MAYAPNMTSRNEERVDWMGVYAYSECVIYV